MNKENKELPSSPSEETFGGRRHRRRQTSKRSKRGDCKTRKRQQRGGQDPLQKLADMMRAGKKQQKKGGKILEKVIGGNANIMSKLSQMMGKQ